MRDKVAIIGAGPGGLSAAREAASLGLSVTIFEKASVGERISCAEGFFDLLKLLEHPIAGIRCKVKEAILSAIDTFTVDCTGLHLWVIDRLEWQKALAEDACRRGCQLYENTPVTAINFSRLQSDYDWIVDSSGVSPVSKAKFKLPPVRLGMTAQYTLVGDFSSLFGKIKVAVEPHYCGYYWVFPKARDCANVGVGWFGKRSRGLQIHQELKRIIEKEQLDHYQILRQTGGPIPLLRRKELVLGNTLLVGDAAGLASPLHGGGIDIACISGILAARAIGAASSEQYMQSVQKILGSRQNLEQKIFEYLEKTEITSINEFMKIGFGQPDKISTLKKIKQAITQEATLLQYVMQGHVQADWTNGLILDDLPLTAKPLIRKIMSGQITH